MKILVMKFGGSSLADPGKIQRAAERISRARRLGFSVAAVASAPGNMTDELLDLSRRLAGKPSRRELDCLMASGEQISVALLAMALQDRGIAAVSLTGAQAGIKTRGPHGSADIAGVRPARPRAELAAGRVVVAAGFQGVNEKGDLATLGRGGSDLTAVALAAALKARACEIFTDVKGIYTADPRLVPEARRLASIGFSEMLELAQSGAQVMQPRSIAYARLRNVAIHVRSAFHDAQGTWIGLSPAKKTPGVAALALARLGESARLSAVGSGLGAAEARLMAEALRARGITWRRLEKSRARVSFFVGARQAVEALRALHAACGFRRA